MPHDWDNSTSTSKRASPISRPKRRSRLGLITDSWKEFISYSKTLEEALGPESVLLLRVAINEVHRVESALGVPRFIELVESFRRLIVDLLPPHFPVLKLPQGDLLIAVDSMMVDFFARQIVDEAQKLKRICDAFSVSIDHRAAKNGANMSSLDELLEPFQPSPRIAKPLSPRN